MTDTTEPLFIDVERASELVGVSTRTVYRLTDKGQFPRPLKIGRQNRWHRKGVLDWLENGAKPVR